MVMSCCISLETDGNPVGDEWSSPTVYAPLWRQAGADLAAFHGRSAASCLPLAETAVAAIRQDPALFEAVSPGDGWGDAQVFADRLQELADTLGEHPTATVLVSR